MMSPEEAGGRALPRIVTIGAYGFGEEEFFSALRAAGVDTFCDIRLRRGMRGPTYVFANSARLQRRLGELGVRYLHLKELAPDQAIREYQNAEDKRLGQGKRQRRVLGEAFVRAYEAEKLASFDAREFLERVGPDARVVCLFCVEGMPEACHRSLVAARLENDLGIQVRHIRP